MKKFIQIYDNKDNSYFVNVNEIAFIKEAIEGGVEVGITTGLVIRCTDEIGDADELLNKIEGR